MMMLLGIILLILFIVFLWKLVISPLKTGNKKIKSSEKIHVGYGRFNVNVEDNNNKYKRKK